MSSTSNEIPTFHLGITMAGAVSAGAYTAGFMDYLLEVLTLWEVEKEKIRFKLSQGDLLTEDEKKIPLYDVKVEVLGGASAGGMVSVMSLLSLYKEYKPVKKPTNKRTGNILYDSWVLLDDDLESKVSTFEKMLALDDLEEDSDSVTSLLNSKPIDRLADTLFEEFKDLSSKKELPSYISKDARVLLTLCNLKGISFESKFQQYGSRRFDYEPGHRMTEHTLVAHFKTNYNITSDADKYLNFNINNIDALELIKQCTKATGAFPIGLKSRNFKDKISQAYVKNALLRSMRLEDTDAIDVISEEGYWYNFTSIDGGTINNEPYDEVMQVLKEKFPNQDETKPTTGVLLIDPFPNFYKEKEKNKEGKTNSKVDFFNSIFSVLFRLVETLLNQVLVKRMGFLYEKDFRVLAFPIKWTNKKSIVTHPKLASSALGGFGGFLDIEFRKHDFFLGRKNAQNMLNSYFSLQYDKENLNPLFTGLSQEMIDAFIHKKMNRFPVIPDVNKVLLGKEYSNPYEYECKDYPKLNASCLNKIKKPLKKRISLITKIEINNNIDKSWVFRFIAQFARVIFLGKLSRYLLEELEKDLKNREQL